MKTISWVAALFVLWIILTGSFNPLNLSFGLCLSIIVTYCMRKTLPVLPSRPWITLRFIGFMLKSLFLANLKVAQDVLRFNVQNHPGIIAFPISTHTEDQAMWLANMITLTPGTLVLDFSQNKKLLFVHVMFLRDREAIFRELKDLENRIMELLPE